MPGAARGGGGAGQLNLFFAGGPVDVETLKQMEPRSNVAESIVFIGMMAAFAYIRLKFDRAVAARYRYPPSRLCLTDETLGMAAAWRSPLMLTKRTRQERVDAEEELRQAKSAK